jgi:hypothetical protein
LGFLALFVVSAACGGQREPEQSDSPNEVGDGPESNEDNPVSGGGTRDAGTSKTPDAAKAPATRKRDAGSTGPSAQPVNAKDLIKSGDSVFFVGNSFFGWEGRELPVWIEALGQANQPAIAINTGSHLVPGNNPLSWFYQQQESQDAIESGRYDVFILQGEEHEPRDDKEGFQQAVRDYHKAITAKGGRVMLFMTWDFDWDTYGDFFPALVASYEEIGKELGIPVIPVGLIYDDCRKDPYGSEQGFWLNNDDGHQNVKGFTVNAYATFSMLTGINPQGRYIDAEGNTNTDDELMRYLSDKSWERVKVRLSAK